MARIAAAPSSIPILEARRAPARGFAGIIADTHGRLRPGALGELAGAGIILHAGDIGSPEVLAGLSGIAPVAAVRGNNDSGAWARNLPDTLTVRYAGRELFLLHDLHGFGGRDPAAYAAVISGHSHRARVAREGGALFLNPGSAGPRRFRLPVTVARLWEGPGGMEAEIVPVEG